jgi:succinyl-diaminopimelate desuccinylase
VAERPNLIVELDFGPGGHTLGLCGHLDTKPVGEGRWSTDPLQAAQVNGELRGRGVVDMKGAIGAMLLAAADLVAEPPARGRLLLVLPADEENGAVYGGQWLAEHQPIDADAIVIGEPGGLFADWDRLHLGSRGICNFDIDIVTEQGIRACVTPSS